MPNFNNSSYDNKDPLQQLTKRAFDDLAKANTASRTSTDVKTIKLFGIMEVPETFGVVVYGIWNQGIKEFTNWFQQHSFPQMEKIGAAAGLQGSTLVRSATVATVMLNTGLQSLAYINPVIESYKKLHTDRLDLARKIAPVLDDLKGRHSAGALSSVKMDEDEVLYAANFRLRMEGQKNLKNKITKLMVNVLPNLVTSLPQTRHMWNDKFHTGDKIDMTRSGPMKAVDMVVSLGTDPVADSMNLSSDRAFKNQFSTPYSTLAMALELESQVSNNPKATSFQLPNRGDSLSLEHYIAKMITNHQKEMADISPDHTEIRTALRDDVAAIAIPLAEAIRNGGISALSLIELIGRGKLIKSNGRAVAPVPEVEDLIERTAPKKAALDAPVDIKGFFTDAPYTEAEFKAVVNDLELDQQALFPNALLEKVGVSAKRIKEVNDRRAEATHPVDRFMADVILGADSESDEVLKANGLTKIESKKFHDAAAKIESDGLDALSAVKSTVKDPNGVDRLVGNLIVGHKEYLGSLAEKGHARFESMGTSGAAAKFRGTHTKEEAAQPKLHASHERHDDGVKNTGKFAKNEDHRRSSHDGHHERDSRA